MAGPVLGYVVGRIGDFLTEEYVLLRDVDREVKRLQDELKQMACFLEDADIRRNSNAEIKNWVREVRTVAYEAEDLVESFALDVEKNRQGQRGFIRRYIFRFRFPKQLQARHNFGRDIQLLMERIDDIGKRRQRYGIADLSADDNTRRYVDKEVAWRRRAVLHASDSDVVGMEDEKKAILDLLFRKSVTRLSVVSIVGMGGLGKTTLAKKVYKDPRIKSHFNCSVWIDVSQQYKDHELLKDLYMKVTKKGRKEVGKMIGTEIEERLHDSLRAGTYLIVMDDVWDKRVWKILEQHLPDEGNGSRVLITTRTHDVGKPYPLRFLNDEESWELFLRKAFPQEDGRKACQGEFEKVGKRMVRKCGGLPLALVVIGGLLSQKERLVEWDKIEKTLVWAHENEGKQCMKILALSYSDLPRHLKWCFLYLGAFPEDFEIDVKKLIRLWIAEGFVQGRERERITLEELAEQYLEELVLRCLVQVEDWSPGNVERCRVHDLLHELAVEESNELNFFHCQQKALDRPNILEYSSLRRFSLHMASEEFLSQLQVGYPRLRTLLGFKLDNLSMGFPTSGIQLIRVMDLEGAPIELVPEQVGDLANLRYLGLMKTMIKSLPKSIQKLSRLQSLDIRGTRMTKMNDVVWKIEALRQVLVSPSVELCRIQKGNLRNLQVLEEAKAGDWMNNCLSKLTNLQTLRLASIQDAHHQQLSEILPRFSHLTTLKLSGTSIPAISLMLSNIGDLHWLFLSGTIKMPNTLRYEWPSRLSTLTLYGTELDQDPLPSLGKLTDLRVLVLLRNSYRGREMTCPSDTFPQLRILRVEYLAQLEKWVVDNRAMPRLKNLRISGSRELTMLPQGLKSLDNLENLFLLNLSSTLYARVHKENGEDWENIQHIPSIIIENVRVT